MEVKRSARLCLDNTTAPNEYAEFNTFADCAQPISWRTGFHLGGTMGATIVRRDIKRAHQMTPLPVGVKQFTQCAAGHPFFVNGRKAVLAWTHFLNGNPVAGNGFDEHLMRFRFEGHGFTKVSSHRRTFALLTPSAGFLWIFVIVDDIAVVTLSPGDVILLAFDAHLGSPQSNGISYEVKKLGIDGFLNMDIEYSP
eukprot:4384281-Prymnesium_polylepis.1